MREHLQAVLRGVAVARQEPLKGHPLAHLIEHQWRDALIDSVGDPSYLVKGSSGAGGWAQTVWLAIFDRIVTTKATEGFYLVYLIHGDGGRAYLSLNQATTEVREQVGGRYRSVLANTAVRDKGLIAAQETHGFVSGPIDLGGGTMYTRGYESGNIYAAEYGDPLPSQAQLEDDLTRLLLLYQALIEGRDQVEQKGDTPESASASHLEARKYRWHRRAERSRSLAAEAKKIHGTRCQVSACGKDLSDIYGELGEGYIEAHHLTPFASLEGRPTELNPVDDFAVVCPDCHRMIHRRADPYSLAELSDLITISV
jgi:5-methylcytosine-specific restriction protein A